MRLFGFAMLLTLAAITLPSIATAKANPASAELLADVSAVAPGATFHLAVRLTMQPGWHVYWMNPGDSGLPTTVTFHVPDGFKVELLPDPVPTKFDQPGGVIGYGYADSVMLVATVTGPADLKAGSPLAFSADAKWLVCKDVCIPGKASPSLQLPAGAQATADNQKAIQDALARLPRVLKEDDGLAITRDGDVHTVTFPGLSVFGQPEAFPAPGDGWEIHDLQIKHAKGQVIVTYTAKQLDQSVKSAEMTLLLAYDDENGHRHGVQAVDLLSSR